VTVHQLLIMIQLGQKYCKKFSFNSVFHEIMQTNYKVLSETRIFVRRIFYSEWYKTRRYVTSIRVKLCVTEVLDLNGTHQLLVYADNVNLLDQRSKEGTLLHFRSMIVWN
jgi:hypothetical protein